MATWESEETKNRSEVLDFLRETRNWGRWGDEDQKGAINLVTEEKTLSAARLVTTGRTVSLSRPIATAPASNNRRPPQHFTQRLARPEGVEELVEAGAGTSIDHLGMICHGQAITHIDALCHAWDSEGMWNGRDPEQHVGFEGATWGGLEHWKDGIVTRGVLLDVPRHRGTPYVTQEQPVTGPELREVARSQGVELAAGDAIVIHSGREAWSRDHGPYGNPAPEPRPGLNMSCLEALRDWDCALLVWDMMDERPNAHGLPWGVHSAIFAHGVALVDNALIEPLAQVCQDLGRHEFMLNVAPLHLEGGTGSAINPIAVF